MDPVGLVCPGPRYADVRPGHVATSVNESTVT